MAEAKKDVKKKVGRGSKLYKAYEVKGNSLVRLKKFSPKAGEGFFMAEHKDRRTCGKTMYMEKKSK
ncbi:30S ribosomal protein S27ae [Candidatus Woesearchaeota archaeon]|nr:30S ribosomal protein S27ae [Candidatus Woesearchaeota archaeon]